MLFNETTVGGTRSAQASVTNSVVIVERIWRRVRTNKLIKFPALAKMDRTILITPNVQYANGERKPLSTRRLGSLIRKIWINI